MDMYESIMKEKFAFIRQWHKLRSSPKYAASLAKKIKATMKDNQPSSPSVESPHFTSHGVEFDEIGMERPIGRKAAKKMKRAAYEAKDGESLEILKSMQKEALAIASSRSESVNMSLQLQKEMMEMQKEEQERQKEIIQLQKEKLQLRLAKEERERHKEERERHVYEASIMATDTSMMAPDQAKYYDALKARILKNMS